MDRALADRRIGPPLARASFFAAGTALGSRRMRRGLERVLPGYGVERSPDVAREWRSGGAWRSFYREQRALFDELPALRRERGPIRMPLTVVVGTRDFITDPGAGKRFAAEHGGRVVEVKGAGHLLPMQAPGRVAEAIASA
jgi:pimeloyl-ACP methyl ester carboxylesterase